MNIATSKLKIKEISTVPKSQSSTADDGNQLVSLVESFSWFSLSEVSHSTFSGLQGYYGRIIMNELAQPNPRQDEMDHWHAQIAMLAAIERDSTNFMTRKKMENIIIKYSSKL